MGGLRKRALGAAVAGILLALPSSGVWAGPDGHGKPPEGGMQPGEGHRPEMDKQQMCEMVRNKLENHPKYKRVWERMDEEQRRKCVERVAYKMCLQMKELRKCENSPQKFRQKKEELKRQIRERREKRSKDAEGRRDRDRPREGRRDR